MEGSCSHYTQAWEATMRDMKKLKEDAFKHLIAIPPRQVIHNFLIEQY